MKDLFFSSNRICAKRKCWLILFACLIFSSCKNYSFTGASIAPEIKTVSIAFFPNRAAIVQPSLSQSFTEKLRDKFVSQTNLNLVQAEGDLRFEGSIQDYQAMPAAIQGNDNAALNRLTISVNVKFTNTKDSKHDFDRNFSRYADYDSKLSLTSVEQELISQINSQLVDDIFNQAIINW